MATEPSDVFWRVCDGSFFDMLEEMAWRGDAKLLWPWLKLLTTDAIEAWARNSPTMRRVVGGTRCHGEEVLRLLFTRRLIHVPARRDPSAIQEFSRWAFPDSSYSVMQQCCELLPSTVGEGIVTVDDIVAQERDFTSLLDTVATELSACGGPRWAIESLGDLLARRREPVRSPAARVVFAWDPPHEFCRRGFVVDFRLLARSGAELSLTNREPFDERFLASLERDVRLRVDDVALRHLEHDWAFLPPKTLGDSSGTTAFWVAYALASPGRRFGAQTWAVPPWVVISAAIDREAAATFGGVATEVNRVDDKLQVLAEEGVRVVVLSGGSMPLKSAHRDIVTLRILGNACDVGNKLLEHGLLLPADLSTLESKLVDEAADRSARRRITERERAHLSFSHDHCDCLPPEYAFRELQRAMGKLNGRGCIHLTAPAGQGKSVLARALHPKAAHRDKAPAILRNALVCSLLRGEPANPRFLLDRLGNQARWLDDSGLLHLRDVDQLDSVPGARQWIKHLLEEVRMVLAERDNFQPLLLVIDGIDELLGSAETGDEDAALSLDLLLPPSDLPEGCFVLILSRPSIPASLSAPLSRWQKDCGPHLFKRVELSDETEGYANLLEAFLLEGLGHGAQCLIPLLIEKSGGSFLFIRLLRDLVRLLVRRGRILSELTAPEIPNLTDVFPAYLDEIKLSVNYQYEDPNRFDRWHRPVLLMLAAAYEPVDFATLRFWLHGNEAPDPDTDHVLECTLDELAPLLRDDKPRVPENRTVYSIGHAEFGEWLSANDHPDWGPTSFMNVRRSIAHRAHRLFEPQALEGALASGRLGVIYYHYWHLPSHLLDIGDSVAAREFLAADWQDWFNDSIMAPMRGSILWSEAVRVAAVRTRQFFRILQDLPRDRSAIPTEMWCVRRLGESLLRQVEGHVGLGQPAIGLRLIERLAARLRQITHAHLGSTLTASAQREYWRLVIEQHLWRARIGSRLGERKAAAGAIRDAYAQLVPLSALFTGEGQEGEVVWWASSLAEIIERFVDLCRDDAPTPTWLGHNHVSLEMLQALVEEAGGLTYWADSNSRVVAALASARATQLRLFLDLAFEHDRMEDGCGTSHLSAERATSAAAAALEGCGNLINELNGILARSRQEVRAGGEAVVLSLNVARSWNIRSSLGKLMLTVADAHRSCGNRRKAAAAYCDVFEIFEDLLPIAPADAIEYLLRCCIGWVEMDGPGAKVADGVPVLVRAPICLTIYYELFAQQIVTDPARQAVQVIDGWIRKTTIYEQLGDEFQAAWQNACRAFQRSSVPSTMEDGTTGISSL